MYWQFPISVMNARAMFLLLLPRDFSFYMALTQLVSCVARTIIDIWLPGHIAAATSLFGLRTRAEILRLYIKRGTGFSLRGALRLRIAPRRCGQIYRER